MNVLEKSKRRWKKARKRGVSPIIATILLVAITVVLAAVLYVLISGLTSGGANTVPIGTSLSLGAPTQSATACGGTSPAGECYTITVQSAGSSATTGNVHFSVRSGGSPIGTQPGITLVALDGTTLATWSGTSWTIVASGFNGAFNSTQTLILSSSAPVSGDQLVAIGVGALQGTTAYNLP